MNPLKHILLVEDNPKDLELTLAVLEDHHLANGIAVARDGTEALDYLRARGQFQGRAKGLPAVVLLDIKMPKMTGIEVLRQMKADSKLHLIPVVMLTSSREEPDLTQCYALGVNAYVVKPVGFPEFVDAVKQVGVFWAMLNEPPPGLDQPPHHA
ncbi:MAG: chemotaxis protein CheY [Lacunisphaera sp.]|nr:chemotaxis protein CheY [Lacunisphaera sp.]